jgi:hypothetical protein
LSTRVSCSPATIVSVTQLILDYSSCHILRSVTVIRVIRVIRVIKVTSIIRVTKRVIRVIRVIMIIRIVKSYSNSKGP